MQNINMRESNDRKADLRAGFADFSAEPAFFFSFSGEIFKKYIAQIIKIRVVYFRSTKILEVIPIAILFSQVKVQSVDQSETFLISGIPKECDDLTASVQLEWFLQDIDSDEPIQVHADAFLYGEGEVVNATHAELCYFLDRIRLNPSFLESRCQSAGSSDFSFNWSPDELFGQQFTS